MNWDTILTNVWGAVNSPFGIGILAAVVLWVLNRLYAKKPQWKKYEGTIIAAVKLAEKQIPDDTPNKAAAKLDAALRYVLNVHREVENRRATAQEVAAIREGIQIVHANLETGGALATAVKTACILLLACCLAFSGSGCTTVVVSPGAGPVNVGATSSLVTTEGQETDSRQAPATQPMEDVDDANPH